MGPASPTESRTPSRQRAQPRPVLSRRCDTAQQRGARHHAATAAPIPGTQLGHLALKLNYSPPELLDDLGLANHKRGKLLIARTPRTRVHISQVRVGLQMPSPGPEQSRYTRVWRPTSRDTSPPRDGGR